MGKKVKLMVEIDENDYERLVRFPSAYASPYCQAIRNGTPYNPTGDLISREALKTTVEKEEGVSWDSHGKDDLCVRKKYIDNAPTVPSWEQGYEAGLAQGKQDRPQGEWKPIEGIDGDEYYECSNCGEPWVLMAGTPKDNNMNFCPNCGADMRKGDAK